MAPFYNVPVHSSLSYCDPRLGIPCFSIMTRLLVFFLVNNVFLKDFRYQGWLKSQNYGPEELVFI